MSIKWLTRNRIFLMPDNGGSDSAKGSAGDSEDTESFTENLRKKRAAAGRAGGKKTASIYNMKSIGALGGKAAQAKGTAHRLTKEERAKGGMHSRRKKKVQSS